ncbi:MAG: A24 family peptidase [Nanoarchaeota archaeon]|nr:A24 family peptidase [Nanoarchaeota archaeon]
MVDIFIIIVALVVLAIASLNDIRTREVPDWLSYGLIFTGLAIGTLKSIATLKYTFILYSAFGFAVFFAIACLMYYTGQWGGGDSKLLMGLGALIGLRFEYSIQFMFMFLFNLLVVGAIYGFAWSITLALKNRQSFRKSYLSMLKDSKVAKMRSLVITISISFLILFIVSLFVFNTFTAIPLLMISMLAFLFFYLFIFSKSVENSCMVKPYPVSKLTEGDWIANDVIIKGKHICGPKDLGISKKQILILQKLKLKSVLVKEGIPFVPSFFFAFIATWLIGNWFLLL